MSAMHWCPTALLAWAYRLRLFPGSQLDIWVELVTRTTNDANASKGFR